MGERVKELLTFESEVVIAAVILKLPVDMQTGTVAGLPDDKRGPVDDAMDRMKDEDVRTEVHSAA